MTQETKLTPEKMAFYLELHGHVPWTVTIADCLERGIQWDTASISKTLWHAQGKIDELTQQLKEKNNANGNS